jgi:hypothetical protein
MYLARPCETLPGPASDRGDVMAREGPVFTGDERAEPERLRAENAALRAGQPAAPPAAPRVRRWRPVVATLLIVVGCVLAPLSVVAVWTRSQVTDTDRYVATVAPLARDPAIQQAIADQVTVQVWLPVVAIVLLVTGVYVAADHRRALAGAGLAASMVLPALGLAVFRSVYLDSVPATVLPHAAAAVLYDTIVRFLRLGLRIILVLVLALLGALALIEFLGRRPAQASVEAQAPVE